MAAKLLSLRLLSALMVVITADPAPARVPKVYNALITSNQNLEPSKAYPVYQPVLHDPFGFPLQPAIFYGGNFPFGNGLVPLPAQQPKANQPSQPPAEAPNPESDSTPAPEEVPTSAEPASASPDPVAPSSDSTTPAPPLPPNTESPIPLNQFGLPAQILPLGQIHPAYSGFTQLGPFTYSYPSFPGLRLYDPFDPFTLGPYGLPLYRPLPNVITPNVPLVSGLAPVVPAPTLAPIGQSADTPAPEPSDLNILNYSSKDPAIPNVPPPPLPKGGLKSDKSE